MTHMFARFRPLTFLACLSVSSLAAQVYDCKTGLSGVSFYEVFRQVAEGLDYTADGEIVRAPGKTLPLTENTRIAFFHYVARMHPTVSISMYVRCDSCQGKGGHRGLMRDPGDSLDLGVVLDFRCGKCNGTGGSTQNVVLTVTHSGPLPPLPPSPKLIVFGKNLASARDGSVVAQLAVAKAYMEGVLVPRNLVQARDWYAKAAGQGEREALAPLGRLYADPGAPFHDLAFGLALEAVADPSLVKAEGQDFVAFHHVANNAPELASGLARHLQVLEAGLLAPQIARGLANESTASQVLLPESVRRSFPAAGPAPDPVRTGAQVLFARGLARYFGFGFPAPDHQEGLRLIEAAACQADAKAMLFLALHFDAAEGYPASAPTAWAFYAVAEALGVTDDLARRRMGQLAGLGVAADWAEVPEILRTHLLKGRFTPATLRELADLSRYRRLSVPAGTPGMPSPFAVAATQETPLSRAQVFSRARSMLNLKLATATLAPDDASYFRKCWDDGVNRFYSVSGLVTFTNAAAVRETTPYTVCFKVTDAASAPTMLYCAAGSFVLGEYPSECLRQP